MISASFFLAASGSFFSSEAEAANDTDTTVVFAGEAVDLIDTIEPAARIVERITREADDLVGASSLTKQ